MDTPEDARPNDDDEPEASGSPLKPDDSDSSPPAPDSPSDAPERLRLNLGPLFDPALMSPVALALSESTRVSNSIQRVTAGWAALGTQIAQTNAFAVSSMVAWQTDLANIAAQSAASFRAPLSLASGLDLFQPTPILSPALLGLGQDYSASLGALARSTSDAYRIGFGIPELEAGLRDAVWDVGATLSAVTASVRADVSGIVQSHRLWQDSLAASVPRVTAAAFADIPSFASQVRSLSAMTPALSIASRLVGIDAPEVFAGALADGLPAAARYAVTVQAADVFEEGSVLPAVTFVTAWVQSAMARLSIRLSPDVFLQLVVGILQLVMAIDASTSSSVATERIIAAEAATRRAVEEQTEILRDRLPSEDNGTHVVVSAVRLRAAPSESSSDVGEAYPNQAVRLEAVEDGWCRITFDDRVAGQTRAGWVPASALRGAPETSNPAAERGHPR